MIPKLSIRPLLPAAGFYPSLDLTKLPWTELKAEPWDPTMNPLPGSSGADRLHLIHANLYFAFSPPSQPTNIAVIIPREAEHTALF